MKVNHKRFTNLVKVFVSGKQILLQYGHVVEQMHKNGCIVGDLAMCQWLVAIVSQDTFLINTLRVSIRAWFI